MASATLLVVLREIKLEKNEKVQQIIEDFRREVVEVVRKVVRTTKPIGREEGKGVLEGGDEYFETWVHPSVVRVMEWVMGEGEGKGEGLGSLHDLIVV